jgi:hypothetical protein
MDIQQIYPWYQLLNPVGKTLTRFDAFDFMTKDGGQLGR